MVGSGSLLLPGEDRTKLMYMASQDALQTGNTDTSPRTKGICKAFIQKVLLDKGTSISQVWWPKRIWKVEAGRSHKVKAGLGYTACMYAQGGWRLGKLTVSP